MGSEMSDMSMSDNYEKYFMPFILVLVVCLLLSVYFYKPTPKNAFGFMYKDGKCVKVNAVPQGKPGDEGTVYSNANDCARYCGAQSYRCVFNGSERECIPSNQPVDADHDGKNGYYINRDVCGQFCRENNASYHCIFNGTERQCLPSAQKVDAEHDGKNGYYINKDVCGQFCK